MLSVLFHVVDEITCNPLLSGKGPVSSLGSCGPRRPGCHAPIVHCLQIKNLGSRMNQFAAERYAQ